MRGLQKKKKQIKKTSLKKYILYERLITRRKRLNKYLDRFKSWFRRTKKHLSVSRLVRTVLAKITKDRLRSRRQDRDRS